MIKGTKFISASVADFNDSHYIEMPVFQKGMLDLLDRRVSIVDRIQALPATGHPTRYWEQTKLPDNTLFVDPRKATGGNYGNASLDTDYGRVERSAVLKCLTTEISYTLFDKQLVQQQSLMEQLLTKDMQDMIVSMKRAQNKAIWTGKATDLMDTTNNEYCGLLTQIKDKYAVADPYDFTKGKGTFITDAIRTQIAKQCADTTYDAYPTAIYANPITIDYINRSELERTGVSLNFDNARKDLGNGFFVSTIRTAYGELPLIPDPFIPVTANTDKNDHIVVAVNERLLERHYLTSSEPQVFKMSQNKDLLDDYVAVLFDTVIAKGVDAHAHFQLTFTI